MANVAYIHIKGSSSGLITEGVNTDLSMGNSFQVAHVDESTVQAFDHEVSMYNEAESDRPMSRRIHKPVVVTKVIDKASPKLYAALCHGELIIRATINWYRPSMSGSEEHYFTLTLKDAMITNITTCMPNAMDTATAYLPMMEKISFSYRRIIWTHEATGVEFVDEWNPPSRR